MNRKIRFYDYEQCYCYYVKGIENIRQKRINGETIVAKPVLMVAIIDGIEANMFTINQFVLNDWLERRYQKLMEQFTKNSQFDGTTGKEKPFWHLESDGFWHLHYLGEELSKTHTPSKKWLKENVRYASFDDDLWMLLQNQVMRQRLRDYIIEHKLTDGHRNDIIGIGGIGLITAILLAA